MPARVARMDDVESEAWLGLIALVELLPASLDLQLQRDAGLTHFEYMALSQLRFAPEQTLQTKDLAEATNATLARLSRVATKLEARQLVERTPCTDDRRATNIRLTSAGRRAVIKATSGHLAHVRRTVIDHLDRDELEALAVISRKITHDLDPADRMTRGLVR